MTLVAPGRWLIACAVSLASSVGAVALGPGPAQSSGQVPAAAAATPAQEPVILIGAGDIANCEINDGAGAKATARILDRIPGTVFTAGDHAYPEGTAKQFKDCYDVTWGRFKDRTRPAPGNHDYLTSKAAPYFDYFGESAGPDRRGYYSYNLGAWHIISLNSFIAADKKSPQLKWLRQDLMDNPTACTLAYWHIPMFSSGAHGNSPIMLEAWKVLYEFGADVVINGHDHDYERFAPQDPKGKADPARGIRQFIVGTGGGGVYQFKRTQPNSEVRFYKAYGVIKLTLNATDYAWEFLQGAGDPFQDSGTGQCVVVP
jgi:hypothetical protein